MKYVDDFRDGALARGLVGAIAAAIEPGRDYRIMEFCGGHTHAISRYGLSDRLPPSIRFIHGPGCPVCVLPVGRIDSAIELARRPEVILCSYGDVMRVPASRRTSLLRAKTDGADVRLVWSSADAVRIAQEHPQRQVVFFAIGFETTTPPTAVALQQAERLGLKNFTVFCNHVLTPAAIRGILGTPEQPAADGVAIDAFIGPSHVSAIIGSDAYQPLARTYAKPIVITGFEPLDVLQAVLMLVEQINRGEHRVENQYTRAVTAAGNRKAQALVARYFETREAFEWRGLGSLPASALRLRPEYAPFDAEARFDLPYRRVAEPKSCDCGAILRGLKAPADCSLFATTCTPENPIGACMVSSEGACSAWYSYRRHAGTQATA